MKVLIVNNSDIEGGAARAAYRLHKALLSQNIDSQMLVQNKKSDEFTILTQESRFKRYFNKLRPMIDSLPVRQYKRRDKTLFSPSWFGFSDMVDKINFINPDIVHLHWICGGMIKIEDIAKIRAPIVWSLHDMWAFTGGCHYSKDCEAYLYKCGSCEALGSNKNNDLSKKIFNKKAKMFMQVESITIVGLSKWLSDCAKNSTLLKKYKHVNLPNPINTSIYKPCDKKESRNLWNLPKDKKLILFGAMGALSDRRKGFEELGKALTKLQNKNIEFVVFGSSEPKNTQNFGFKTHYVGSLSDDVSLVALYNAVDVVVVPSLQENLPNVIMESLSCATPAVGFAIGGNNDLIKHKENGYLAKPFDTKDLANGIEWVLYAKNYKKLCINARTKTLKEFDSMVVSGKYVELYKKILNNQIKPI